jgi:tetratricopeptide (TPR) repeat protein
MICSVLIFKSEADTFSVYTISNQVSDTDKTPLMLLPLKARSILNNPLSTTSYKVDALISLYSYVEQDGSYKEIKRIVDDNPKNRDFLEVLATIDEQRKDYSSAIQNRIQISQIDPLAANNYLLLARLYLSTEDTEKARLLFNKIISIAPKTNEGVIAKKELDKLQ